jgi:hypothetical protein
MTYAVIAFAEALRNSTELPAATTWSAFSTAGSCLEAQRVWDNVKKLPPCARAGVTVTALINISHANRVHGMLT